MNKSNQILLTIIIFLFAGCARLPDYAVPKQVKIENLAEASAPGVTYRTLTAKDFRAKTDPVLIKEAARHLNARITTIIRLKPDVKLSVESKPQDYQFKYYGKIENIAFEAVMVPDYSWWSPKLPPFKWPYTLQHEQIHFAIAELTARRLSRDAKRKMLNFVVNDITRHGTKKQLEEKVATLRQGVRDSEMKKQLEFDMETSLYFNPDKQQEWFDDITTQLKNINFEQ
jgi:hypothetical protein